MIICGLTMGNQPGAKSTAQGECTVKEAEHISAASFIPAREGAKMDEEKKYILLIVQQQTCFMLSS